jgi:hypothetical protein
MTIHSISVVVGFKISSFKLVQHLLKTETNVQKWIGKTEESFTEADMEITDTLALKNKWLDKKSQIGIFELTHDVDPEESWIIGQQISEIVVKPIYKEDIKQKQTQSSGYSVSNYCAKLLEAYKTMQKWQKEMNVSETEILLYHIQDDCSCCS